MKKETSGEIVQEETSRKLSWGDLEKLDAKAKMNLINEMEYILIIDGVTREVYRIEKLEL